jgi:hypothetical protein
VTLSSSASDQEGRVDAKLDLFNFHGCKDLLECIQVKAEGIDVGCRVIGQSANRTRNKGLSHALFEAVQHSTLLP